MYPFCDPAWQKLANRREENEICDVKQGCFLSAAVAILVHYGI